MTLFEIFLEKTHELTYTCPKRHRKSQVVLRVGPPSNLSQKSTLLKLLPWTGHLDSTAVRPDSLNAWLTEDLAEADLLKTWKQKYCQSVMFCPHRLQPWLETELVLLK